VDMVWAKSVNTEYEYGVKGCILRSEAGTHGPALQMSLTSNGQTGTREIEGICLLTGHISSIIHAPTICSVSVSNTCARRVLVFLRYYFRHHLAASERKLALFLGKHQIYSTYGQRIQLVLSQFLPQKQWGKRRCAGKRTES
jgi:hypothetical protein